MLSGKRIVVGVTGGIAAYKAADLVSALVKHGASIRVVMTDKAKAFIAPLTLGALAGHPVAEEGLEAGCGVTHIELARWADLLIIAPATANTIGKLAVGMADDLLSQTLLAYSGPVLICPAMNHRMYRHPAVQSNINVLKERGCLLVSPEEGRLACGEKGVGRLAELNRIVDAVTALLTVQRDLEGLRFLVTAGPTREPLDPVRFLTNRSSGRMGYAVAEAACERGARVTLVTGPTSLPLPAGVRVIRVTTAQEMLEAVMAAFEDCDVVVKVAAVADFRPCRVCPQKIKKGDRDGFTLHLERTPDILSALAAARTHQMLVGFAAETESLEEHALAKVRAKSLDLLVANDVSQPGSGFEAENNAVTLVYPGGAMTRLQQMSKKDVAHAVLNAIVDLRQDGGSGDPTGVC